MHMYRKNINVRIYASMCVSLWISQLRGVRSTLRDQSVFLYPALFKGQSTVYVREKQKEKIKEKRRKFYTITVRYKNVCYSFDVPLKR